MCNVPCQLCGDSDECELDISEYLEYLQIGSHPEELENAVCEESD